MQIGETIREYRKKKKLTQEQMAHMLGVSTPAVNKWENGVSYPDITLLAPIARLLDIQLDTLLSFEQKLTDEQINHMLEDLIEILSKENYDTSFKYAIDLIRQYPNCDKLTLNICSIMQYQRMVKGISDKEYNNNYKDQIQELYVRLSDSNDTEIASSACSSLATECMSNKDYDQAQLYLDRIPKRSFDKRMMQAGLYKKQGKKEEAFQLYEKIIYSSYMNMSMALGLLSVFYCEEGQKKTGKELAIMGQHIAETLQMGKHQSAAPLLAYAGTAKDPILTIKALKMMMGSMDSLCEIRKSILFAHQPAVEHKNATDGSEVITNNSKKKDTRFVNQYKDLIGNILNRDDSDMNFLKDNKEFQELMKNFASKNKEKCD